MPRVSRCSGRDSNPHGPSGTLDPKFSPTPNGASLAPSFGVDSGDDQHRTRPEDSTAGSTRGGQKKRRAKKTAEPEAPRPVSKRRSSVPNAFKSENRGTHRSRCEVCGWLPPVGLEKLGRTKAGRLSMLHAHHVLPITCGGPDAAENLVLVCPNCHVLAHALGEIGPARGKGIARSWNGPASRGQLLHELKLLRPQNSREWDEYVAGGRDYTRHLENELIRAERRFTVVRGGAA